MFKLMASRMISVNRSKYDFRPDVLDVIISGRSALDTPHSIELSSSDEVSKFVNSYGYDLEMPIESAEVLGNFHEAINFVRKNFLQPENPAGLKMDIPRRILEITDVRDLFLMASDLYPGQSHDSQGALLREFACSVLKVMHTIAHIDKDLRASYFGDIQRQIFDRFYKVIHRDGDSKLYLGERTDDPARIDLVEFQTKPKKARDSIILKLLHKPENVAEDIFDRVGVRFITPTRLDAIRVVKYLKDKMIVISPNIKPSRSRNTLVDIGHFRSQLADCLERAGREKLSDQDLTKILEEAAIAPSVNPDNPHSSEFYRAIQFTCRQLIKLKNPLYDNLRDIKTFAKNKTHDEKLLKAIEGVDLKYVQREIRFFYPFEVQIMDIKSAEENERGRSAHSEYKKAQLQTALKRVMGTLADGVRQ